MNTVPLLVEGEKRTTITHLPTDLCQTGRVSSSSLQILGRAKDATFELTDAILLTRNVYSLADLSLSPVFRRKWPSIYEALHR
nr:hypothetical protein [Nostoc flagelliforme]